MQKIRTCFFIAACLCLSQQSVFAADEVGTTNAQTAVDEADSSALQPAYTSEELDDSSSTTDMLSEIIIRPVAVLGSATGLALFVVASPFSGLASIPEPHDAFMTTWNDFVVTPYYFAFRHPLGDYSVELN